MSLTPKVSPGDEEGGDFSFSQTDVDNFVKVQRELTTPQSWGAFFPLFPKWTSVLVLNLCIS